MDQKCEAFFNALYLQWARKLLEYAFRLTGSRDDAEEVVQETFLQAIRQAQTLIQHENVAGWLYLTTRNNAMSTIRLNKRLQAVSMETLEIPVEDNTSLELSVYGCLSRAETELLVRFYQERQSIREIADADQISVTACKMRLIRAREKLKKNFEK